MTDHVEEFKKLSFEQVKSQVEGGVLDIEAKAFEGKTAGVCMLILDHMLHNYAKKYPEMHKELMNKVESDKKDT